MTDVERNILRHLNGETVKDLKWGAAMSAALEFLEEDGLVELRRFDNGNYYYEITEIGRAAVSDAHA